VVFQHFNVIIGCSCPELLSHVKRNGRLTMQPRCDVTPDVRRHLTTQPCSMESSITPYVMANGENSNKSPLSFLFSDTYLS